MLHTVQEAIKLAGVSRRTLYNHSDAGRISYTVGPDGRRRFETAELERVYGQLAQANAQQPAQPFTPGVHTDSDLGKVIEAAIQRATAPLIAEIASLRETLLRIEHKPEAPVQQPKPPATKPAASIADVLASWE